jgi:hypothetical protein
MAIRNQLIILTGLLFFIACKTSKKAINPNDKKQYSANDLVKFLEATNECEYFTVKGDVTLIQPNNQISGNIQIASKKDSIAIISLKKFGIEGFRIKINKDSLFLLDRLNQSFSVYSIADFSKQYKVTLELKYLQDLVTKSCFLPKNISYKLDDSKNNYLVGKSENLELGIGLDSLTFGVNEFMIANNDVKTMVKPSSLMPIPDKRISKNLDIKILPTSNDEMQVKLKWDEINFNAITQFKFDIPKHYSHVK